MKSDNKPFAFYKDKKIVKLPLRQGCASPITLDLQLDERVSRVQRKGNLSNKLLHIKKTFQSIQQPFYSIQNETRHNFFSARRNSLQTLPRLIENELILKKPLKNIISQKVNQKQQLLQKGAKSKSKMTQLDGHSQINTIINRMIQNQKMLYKNSMNSKRKSDLKNREKAQSLYSKYSLLDRRKSENIVFLKQRLIFEEPTFGRYNNPLQSMLSKKVSKNQNEQKGWQTPNLFHEQQF